MKNKTISFKVITVGDSGVGKTAIIRRYVSNSYQENTTTTVGIACAFKDITLDNNQVISLKLIDTAGQEQFRSISKAYFKNADAVLFVFDVSKKDTFDSITYWIKEFNENNSKSEMPKYLLGNKCDLKSVISKDDIDKFLEENKDYEYFETSAKNNISIDNLFKNVAEKLSKKIDEQKDKKQILKKVNKNEKKKKECCIAKADE